MVERTPIFNIVSQILLFLGLVAALAPFAVVAIAATQDLRTVNLVPMPLIPGRHLWENLTEAWNRVDFGGKMLNSFVFATGVALGKVFIAALSPAISSSRVDFPQPEGPTTAKNSLLRRSTSTGPSACSPAPPVAEAKTFVTPRNET